MAKESAHDRLLAVLRKSCVGPPVIAEEESVEPWKVPLDSAAPLLLALSRIDLVRNFVAVLLGIALPLISGPSSKSGLLGCALLLWLGLGLRLPFAFQWLHAKTPAGFYCQANKRNTHLKRAFDAFMGTFTPTPYLRSGEWCTLLPFLWTKNKAVGLKYERVWVQNPNDKEHVACDWVFPPGGHDPARPVVILLTGLAPDTHWTSAGGFVANTAWHLANECNMTAVIQISRGTMDTKVKERVFHGGRTHDTREVVLLAERGMRAALGEGEGAAASPLPLFATGFSMGAIIIANYCGVWGGDSRLAGCVHFSGSYDPIFNMDFKYSDKTWQTYLAYGLKQSLLSGRLGRLAAKRGVDMERVMSRRTASVVDIDIDFVAVFNDYKDGVKGYYRDMGLGLEGKWKNVKVPLLAISARDDPLTHSDSMHAEEFSAGNEHLLFLITDVGGHVGWPWGMKPWERGFDFMTESIQVFVEAILAGEDAAAPQRRMAL